MDLQLVYVGYQLFDHSNVLSWNDECIYGNCNEKQKSDVVNF